MTKDAERVALTLPEAVEQAIDAYERDSVFGSAVRRHHAAALRVAILSYGAARERQGIERAVAVVDERHRSWRLAGGCADEITESGACLDAIRALPVEGETP